MLKDPKNYSEKQASLVLSITGVKDIQMEHELNKNG